MIDKLQQLKGKTKLKICKKISNYYDNMNISFDEDPFAKIAQGISKIYHKVLKLMKFLQTKPQVKNMNIIYYSFYYRVVKTRDENKDIDNKYEDYDNHFITPNHYVGIKPRETILR